MNSRTESAKSNQFSRLDGAAVDGLIAGATAGIAMLGYLLFTSGDAPADLLNRFTGVGIPPSPLFSVIAHLAVSAIYGMIFAVIWRVLRGKEHNIARVLAGFVYSLALFTTAQWLILPAVQSPILELPTLHWGIAHAIYGIVLGYTYRSSVS